MLHVYSRRLCTLRLIAGTLGCALLSEPVAGDHDEAVRRSEG